MTAEHTPPTAAERIADQLHDLASLARRGYAISPETIAGLASDVKQLGGLVAGSDDSTDTLIEQLTKLVDSEGGYIFIDTVYNEAGEPAERSVCNDVGELLGCGDSLDAALRAALASQPKGT